MDAKPGECVELGVTRWGVQLFEGEGDGPRFQPVAAAAETARFPSGHDADVKWTVDGAQSGTGPTVTYAVPEDKLGAEVVVEAWRLDAHLLASPGKPGRRARAKVVVPKLDLVGLDGGKEVPAHPIVLVKKAARFKAKLTPAGALKGTFAWSTSTGARLQLGKQVTGEEVEVTGLAASDAEQDAKLKVTWTSDATGKTYEVEHALTVDEVARRLLFAPFPGSTLAGRDQELLRGPYEVEERGARKPADALADGTFALRPEAVLFAFDTEYEVKPPATTAEPTAEQLLALLGSRVHGELAQDVLYATAPKPRESWNYWKSDPGLFPFTLAHELGHFFDLGHPVLDRTDSDRIQEVAVQRLLMCNVKPAGSLLPAGYAESSHGGLTLHGTAKARAAIIKYGYAVT